MAASIVTFLIDVAGRYAYNPHVREDYLTALDHSVSARGLSMEEYILLRSTLESGTETEIRVAVVTILGTKIQRWIELGKPLNYEQWEAALSKEAEC